MTETWCSNETFNNDANMHLPQYNSIHQERKNKRGGGVCVFIHKKLLFKQRKNVSISQDSNETICIEIINKNSKNIIVSTCYRPPNGKWKEFKQYLNTFFSTFVKEKKKKFFVGDFNINSLDYPKNNQVKRFIDCKGMISVVNKPTIVTKNTASCIDHMYTNSYLTQ